MSIADAPKTLLECIDIYREAGNEMCVPREVIAAWIINQGLWEPTFASRLKECARQMGDALGRATATDQKGHEYKRFVAAKMTWYEEDGKATQKWLWDEALTCAADHAHNAIKYMHRNIAKDICSLRATVEAMNTKNPNLADDPIELKWDFLEGDGNEDIDPKKPR